MTLFGRLSIQSKLILMLLAVSLGSILVVAYVGYTSARDAMSQAVNNHLQSVRISKGNLIKELLANIRDQVVSLSDNGTVVDGMRDFRRAYHELDSVQIDPTWDRKLEEFYRGEFLPALAKNIDAQPVLEEYLPRSAASRYLQYLYIAANPQPYEKKQALEAAGDSSDYTTVHEKYHSAFAKIARVSGFDDVMLIDAETLDVVYSYAKTSEFGTNLETGPYANTNLGAIVRALRKAKDRDDYKLADFEPYRPSLGAPVAFVASPIFDGPRMIGILVFQFPIGEFTRVMTGNFEWRREGLGETGEVYLVGPDFTMRSRSRFMVEHREEFLKTLRESGLATQIIDGIERQGNVLLTLPVRTPTVERALQGKEGIEIIRGYRDVPVVSAYGPIELDSLRWAVIAEMETAEAFEPVVAFGRKVLATGVGVALVVSLLALLWSHSLVRPIRALADGARRVASDGVDVQVHVDTQDEFRELAEAFNDMTRNLKANADQLEQKVRENEELLLNILPAPAAARMQEGDGQLTQSFNDVTVLFAELFGLDALSETLGEDTSLVMLQDLVAAFDEAAERVGVEKVKTVGSSYMAVCGLSVQRPDHTSRTIEFAQELIRIVRRFNRERGTQLVVEIGVNAGPVVGGVVGRKKFIYDLWGDTVTIARGLKSDGVTSIQITASVYERVRDLYPFETLGEVEIRGKGRIPTWTSRVEAATELS